MYGNKQFFCLENLAVRNKNKKKQKIIISYLYICRTLKKRSVKLHFKGAVVSMAFSSSALSHTSSSCLSSFPHAFTTRKTHLRFPSFLLIKAASEPDKGNPIATQTKNAEGSSNAQPQPPATPAAAANKPPPKKPVYSSEFSLKYFPQ